MLLVFNDIDDVMDTYNAVVSGLPPGVNRPPLPKGNPVFLISRVFAEGGGLDKDLVGINKEMFKPAGLGIKPWHILTVEVTPENVRAFWDSMLVGNVIPGKMEPAIVKKLKELRASDAGLFGPGSELPNLDWQGGLGLYVHRSTASFRNVALEPID
jgi:hypothetical protein